MSYDWIENEPRPLGPILLLKISGAVTAALIGPPKRFGADCHLDKLPVRSARAAGSILSAGNPRNDAWLAKLMLAQFGQAWPAWMLWRIAESMDA